MNTLTKKVDLFSVIYIPFNHPTNLKKIFEWFRIDSIRRYKIIVDKECIDNHADLKQIHQYYPSIRTVALIVNPWDRMLKAYTHYRSLKKINSTFEQFIINIEKHDLDIDILKNQIDYVQYNDNGNLVCADFVIRNEFFNSDFKQIQTYFGTNDKLNEQKSFFEYKRLYTESTKEKVAELFSKDIEHFGYEF